MTKRVITGALFAVVLVVCMLLQGWAMFALLSVFMLIAANEMYKAFQTAGFDFLKWPGYAFCVLTIAVQSLPFFTGSAQELLLVPLLASATGAMVHLVLRGKIALESMVYSVFPMLYPGLFFTVLMELLHLNSRAAVLAALVLAFFCASINDVFALFTGMLLGRHKLSPELSPKKTKEGAAGGLLASILFAMAVPALLRLVFASDAGFISELSALPPVWSLALLGLVAGILSQTGDLAASMIKRRCGVKDFGKLLPGHGGVMDRLDGVFFCGAACYVFFKIAGLG